MQNINTQKIEDAVSQLIKDKSGAFNVAQIVAILGVDDKDGKVSERVVNSLQIDGRFFFDAQDNFYSKTKFFNNKSFVITPTAREINDGILIPGHRFIVFVDDNIFPSEIQLKEKDAEDFCKSKAMSDTIEELFSYHLLMGAEQISDFFIAENPDNKNLHELDIMNDKLTLNVFDLKKFYNLNKFSVGDALICKVKNYEKGIIEFQYLAKVDRKEKNIEKFVATYNDSIKCVIDIFENYLELHEQLSWGFFLGKDSNLFGAKGASLDEFIKMTDALEIAIDNGHAILINKLPDSELHSEKSDSDFDDEDNYDINLPDGVGVSSGEISSIEDILHEIGSTLSLNEIDSYILDACSMRNSEFTDFYNRAFNHENLKFADEAQKMVLLNYLEDRFETLQNTYDTIADESKANLRSLILEITDSRNEFFDYLKSIDFNVDKLPAKQMKKIAEATLHLSNILQLLNNPAYELNEDEADHMANSIESMEAILEDTIESVTSTIANRL